MSTIPELEARREGILEEMREIRSLNRGTISEQYLKVNLKGKPVLRGPYYVLSRHEKGKTISVRLKQEELEQTREDVAQYSRFKELFREYAEATERLGEMERESGEEKKTFKRRRRPSK